MIYFKFVGIKDIAIYAVFTNTSQTLPDIRSGAVLNFTRPNKILQDRKKSNNLKQYPYGAGTIWAQYNLIPVFFSHMKNILVVHGNVIFSYT